MQAIQTKYIAPSNNKGARIQAISYAKTIVLPYAYELDNEANHKLVCMTLMEVLGWEFAINTGQLKDGSYVHTLLNKEVNLNINELIGEI